MPAKDATLAALGELIALLGCTGDALDRLHTELSQSAAGGSEALALAESCRNGLEAVRRQAAHAVDAVRSGRSPLVPGDAEAAEAAAEALSNSIKSDAAAAASAHAPSSRWPRLLED